MTTKPDAIYARYSSHNQDDGTSIEVQIEQCERSAGGACRHYIDRAKTGRAMSGRPQLLALLADAEAGKIGRVYVYKFDRLGRAAETHLIAQQLDDAGVQLVSATEGTNMLARGIQLVVAEDYSRQLANRTRDGLAKRFEQGGFTGGMAPFGYRVVERDGRRVLEVNPDEAEVVRGVVNQYLRESVGFKILARRLRERGVPSRRQGTRSKGWTFTSVRALLVNPILAGRVRFNVRKMQLDRRTGRRVPRFNATSAQAERRDEALRIISDEAFAAVAAQIAKRQTGAPHRSRHGIAPLTGLVYCPCGSRCTRCTSHNVKGTYHYYRCSSQLRYDKCTAGAPRIREDVVTAMIQKRVAHIFKHRERIIRRAIEVATAAVRGNRNEAERIKSELAAVDADQARRGELLMDRNIPDAAKAALGRQLAEAEQRRTSLLAALDGLREDANGNTEELARMVRKVFEEARQSLAAATTPAEFNRFVERFVGPMEVGAGGDVHRKQMPPAVAEGQLQSGIAGGRVDTLQPLVTSAFWAVAA